MARSHRISPWGVLAIETVCLPLLLFIGATWLRPNFNRQDVPDWQPVLALAEVARQKNELYVANGLYAQAGKLAARRQDWTGLMAAACGMKKLERERGPYSNTHALLVRAMMAAEAGKSTSGMTAVADAFTALGEPHMAAGIYSRIRRDWPAENNVAADLSADCWPVRDEASP